MRCTDLKVFHWYLAPLSILICYLSATPRTGEFWRAVITATFLLICVLFFCHSPWSNCKRVSVQFSSCLSGTTVSERMFSWSQTTSVCQSSEKGHYYQRLAGSCQRVVFLQLSEEWCVVRRRCDLSWPPHFFRELYFVSSQVSVTSILRVTAGLSQNLCIFFREVTMSECTVWHNGINSDWLTPRFTCEVRWD